MHREDPPSLSIHEEATVSVNWGVMPCYNNLVVFNPQLGHESPATIVGDLAEKWAWQDGGRTLVFTLRQGVRWHDGRPFSSADVKYTFDMVREAPGTTARLRLNPRKLWYGQVQAIEAPDPGTVIFRLKRPQPSLLMMLASGYSPVYPAHVPAAELRTRCVGTGPFKLKEYRPGELIEYVRNPDYFKKGLPYLDGIRFIIIKERGTRIAALQAGRLDVAMPSETTIPARDQLRRAVPTIRLRPAPSSRCRTGETTSSSCWMGWPHYSREAIARRCRRTCSSARK
jgi:peptide/nickel transport system substrate-binding protein